MKLEGSQGNIPQVLFYFFLLQFFSELAAEDGIPPKPVQPSTGQRKRVMNEGTPSKYSQPLIYNYEMLISWPRYGFGYHEA
jgi:hypothetical protein